MTTAVIQSYRCVKCGKTTDWDKALGPKPLCNKCWDQEVESSFTVEPDDDNEHSRKYQLAYEGDLNKVQEPYTWILDGIENELQRIYYRNNRERILAVKRKRRAYKHSYKLTHKAQIKASNRKYNLVRQAEIRERILAHKAEVQKERHKYNLIHQAEIRERKLAHKAEVQKERHKCNLVRSWCYYYHLYQSERTRERGNNHEQKAEVKHQYYLTHKAEGTAYNREYQLTDEAKKSFVDIRLPDEPELRLMKRYATEVVAHIRKRSMPSRPASRLEEHVDQLSA